MPTTINVAAGDATNYETPALVVNLFQGVTQPGGGTGAVRRVSGDVARFLRWKGVGEYATIAHGAGIGGLNAMESAPAIAEGTLLGLYKFDNYRGNGNDADGGDDADGSGGGIQAVIIVERDARTVDDLTRGVSMGTALAESTMIARDW